MALSYIFLGCRYTWKHIGGTCICLLGLGCIILNDTLQEDESSQSTFLGDMLCLSSAVLYACSNVIQETVVKYHDRHQFLGHLGGYGAVIAFIQFMATDFHRVETAHFSIEIIFSMIGFILCLFFMYTNTTAYLVDSDATLFNLSLLTSDVYAVIFSYFFYGSLVSWMYFLAFALVILGLFVYHSEKPPIKIGEDSGAASNHVHILTLGKNDSERNGSFSARNSFRKSNDDVSNINSNKNSFNNSHGKFSYNPIMDDSIDRSVVG
jgi:solute carrier family 35 protein F1/2